MKDAISARNEALAGLNREIREEWSTMRAYDKKTFEPKEPVIVDTMGNEAKKKDVVFLKKTLVGSKWRNIGTAAPPDGTELTNEALSTALKSKTEFTREELRAFRILDLSLNHYYIKSGDAYFEPDDGEYQCFARKSLRQLYFQYMIDEMFMYRTGYIGPDIPGMFVTTEGGAGSEPRRLTLQEEGEVFDPTGRHGWEEPFFKDRRVTQNGQRVKEEFELEYELLKRNSRDGDAQRDEHQQMQDAALRESLLGLTDEERRDVGEQEEEERDVGIVEFAEGADDSPTWLVYAFGRYGDATLNGKRASQFQWQQVQDHLFNAKLRIGGEVPEMDTDGTPSNLSSSEVDEAMWMAGYEELSFESFERKLSAAPFTATPLTKYYYKERPLAISENPPIKIGFAFQDPLHECDAFPVNLNYRNPLNDAFGKVLLELTIDFGEENPFLNIKNFRFKDREDDDSIHISLDNELYNKFGTHTETTNTETTKLVTFPAHVNRISVHPHPNNAEALRTGMYPSKMDFSFHLEDVDNLQQDFKAVVHCKGELAPGSWNSTRLSSDQGQAVTQKYNIRRIVSIELDNHPP